MNFGRTCFIYLAFDIDPKVVLLYCKISQAGQPGDGPTVRNESACKHCPEDLHVNLYYRIIASQAEEDVMHFAEMFPA
jgi:hypothetical protein